MKMLPIVGVVIAVGAALLDSPVGMFLGGVAFVAGAIAYLGARYGRR